MGRHARGRAVPAAVLMLGLLLTACSGDGPPEGYRTLEQGRLRVAVADSWQPVELGAASAFDVVLQDVPDDAELTYRFAASSDYPDDSARGVMAQMQSAAAFGTPDEPGGLSAVERDDGAEMWRWDLTYDDGAYQVVTWALHEDGLTVVVSLTGRDEIPAEMIDAVGESIEILPAE